MNSNINFCITDASHLMINLSRNFSPLRAHKLIPMVMLGCLLIAGIKTNAQDPFSRFKGMGAGASKGSDTTLKHRTEDTIVINYRFLDSSRLRKLDSSVYDFTKKYPIPKTYFDLGNFGTAAKDLVFTPYMQSGFDGGWHAYDIYKFNIGETQFYTTTKPYSEIGYILGSRAEQMINLIHTQNVKQNLNAAFQYRLINAPGTFNNQNTNHNNYRFNIWYQSKNKRYQAFLILLGSKLESAENGGIVNPKDLDSIAYTNRFSIPTHIGERPPNYFQTNPFSVSITTGTFYSTGTYMLRQQYDIIGKKDSVVTDTTVTQLFYPKFRAEHTIQYNTYHYRFVDQTPDTNFYVQHYGFFTSPDTLRLSDYWKDLINDLSLYQFPDSKNPQQFIKAGASLENLKGNFDAGSKTTYNAFVHGEYRNKTRNQKWDVEALGKLYLAGYNAGDYNAYISLKRLISKNLGYLQLGFENVNRTQSFSLTKESSFGFGATSSLKKENVVNIFGSIEQPKIGLKLSANYYLITNYAYLTDYYHPGQETNPFNILQITGDKVFILHKYWVWRLLLVLQQKAGASPVNMPLLVAHSQFGYEGKLGYRNLNIAFGVEARYFSGYKADGYSPMIGQFFVQNNTTIKQHLPDINLYVNLRIRGFTAYVRLENVNALQFNGPGGFGFTNNNFVAPYYPYPGLRIRFGFFWSFVN